MTIRLPLPPSVNALYANIPGVGRITSRRYKRWLKEAGWQILIQKPQRVIGPYKLSITVPQKMRGDIDGRLKAIIDLLWKHRVTMDDSLCASVAIKRGDVSVMEIEVNELAKRKMA